MAYVPKLKAEYKNSIAAAMHKEFGYKSVMQIPKLEKIIVSAGVGEAINNKKLLDAMVSEMALITGQKPVRTAARKSIAGFKLRAGQLIGAKVTLRGDRMFEFMERLISVAIPREKDFKGISDKAFDGNGNYSLGIKEQIIFPEIEYDKIEKVSGMNIAFVTSAKTNEEAKALLTKFGMPFRK